MIVLASASVYRQAYFVQLLGPSGFRVQTSFYDERQHESDTQDPVTLARRHALGKAREVAQRFPQDVVFGLDETIEVRGELLHKVWRLEDGLNVWRKMIGQSLTICTGVAMLRPCLPEVVRSEITHVKVRADLSMVDVEVYLRARHPYDCVGCFRIADVPHFFEALPEDTSNIQGIPHKMVRELVELARA